MKEEDNFLDYISDLPPLAAWSSSLQQLSQENIGHASQEAFAYRVNLL